MTAIIGIDPGQTGAISLILNADVVQVWDMPITEKLSGKGKEVNAYLLNDIIDEAIELAGGELDSCILERVSAGGGDTGTGKRRMGAISAFGFGRGVGVIEGVLAVKGIRVEFVTPAAWKRHFKLTGKDKDASRTLALTQWPDMVKQLKRKKDHGRADAMLIAAYGAAA